MSIKFLRAERESLTHVSAIYMLDNTEFTVNWHCVNGENGRIELFDLDTIVDSEDFELADRIEDAIIEGENDSNNDLELYLFVRDTFNARDCVELETNLDMLALNVSDVQLFPNLIWEAISENEAKKKLIWSVNYAIDDLFMIQYDSQSREFSIPHSSEACWNNDIVQDLAASSISADELARKLGLATDLKEILQNGAEVLFADEETKEVLERLEGESHE